MTAISRACIVKKNQMETYGLEKLFDESGFEFYTLPTEIKQMIFGINKPKYIYENFVKDFNKKVSFFHKMIGEEALLCSEFCSYSACVDCFLLGAYEHCQSIIRQTQIPTFCSFEFMGEFGKDFFYYDVIEDYEFMSPQEISRRFKELINIEHRGSIQYHQEDFRKGLEFYELWHEQRAPHKQ